MLTALPSRVIGLLAGAAVMLAFSLGAAGAAQAGIWTPVASGTTQDITAIDQLGAADLWYATSNGQILRNGVLQLNAPGVSFTDLIARPSGDVAIATAPGGRIYRYASGAWSLISLANSSFDHTSPCNRRGGPYSRTWTPTGDLAAVSWASNTVAYAVGGDAGVVLKTTDAGLHWIDVSRLADGSCRLDNTYPIDHSLGDVAALPGSDFVTVLDSIFGKRFISSDGFTGGAALERTSTSTNCYDATGVRFALDLDNPTRSWATSTCWGSTALGFSNDGAASYDFHLAFRPAGGPSLSGLNDVAIAGGAVMVAGNAGALLVSLDGRNVYRQPADGTLGTTDWLAVDKVDGTHAVAGGRLGRLVTTSAATTIPDLVAPAGSISGPTAVTVGQTATFNAIVADEAGGSGVDPASFHWSAPGLAPATGNPAQLRFTTVGYSYLEVSFADRAGNVGTEELLVEVVAAGDPDPPGGGDDTSPTGTIAGPSTLTAGRTATFVARVVDEPGGSGADLDTVEWSVDDEVVSVGNPTPITISALGRHRLTATFADYAGNLGTATSMVTVVAVPPPSGDGPPPPPQAAPPAPPASSPPPATPPLPIGGASAPPVLPPASVVGTTRVGGARVTLRIAPGCTTAGRALTASVTSAGTGRLSQVELLLDGKAAARDRTAPFSARLPIRGSRSSASSAPDGQRRARRSA
jgi:hypothetical protein